MDKQSEENHVDVVHQTPESRHCLKGSSSGSQLPDSPSKDCQHYASRKRTLTEVRLSPTAHGHPMPTKFSNKCGESVTKLS